MAKHNLKYKELLEYHDMASILCLDTPLGRGSFKTGIGFIPSLKRGEMSKVNKVVKAISEGVYRASVGFENIKKIIKVHIADKSNDDIKKMEILCSHYLTILEPSSMVAAVKCDKYPNDADEGVKVIAKSTIKKGHTIKELKMCMAKFTPDDFEEMPCRIKNYLFDNDMIALGPACYINHSCEPNAKFVWLVKNNMASVKTMRTIQPSEEILVKYCDGYFEENCLCDACQSSS